MYIAFFCLFYAFKEQSRMEVQYMINVL